MEKAGGFWAARTILSAVALVASSLFLAGCGRSVASPACTTKELITAAGKGYLKLPPSHDNDAGRGRIPDTRPDADLDANQRSALCKVLKSETHLPG
jgi:predicted small lipoprotein YifL